jgi:FAD-linked oxidoreductase
MTQATPANTYRNWSGNLQFSPQHIAKPDSIEAMVDIVQQARKQGRKVRMVGTAHSWMPLIETNDVLVSLDNWQGVESVDKNNMVATVRAGTKLHRLGEELFAQGVALANMGDIAEQSIAGAFFTGTHGTGAELGILATQLVGVTLINGLGDVITWHEDEHPDMMNAVRVSLGALGMVAMMQVRVMPAYKLHEKQVRLPMRDAHRQRGDFYKTEHRHAEFFWFPHSQDVVFKTLNLSEDDIKPPRTFDLILENRVVNIIMALGARFPAWGARLNKTMMGFVDKESMGTVNHAHQIFPTQRRLRFNEMEYNVPAEQWQACFDDLRDLYHSKGFGVNFPIEGRWVQGDAIWLSPAYGRDSAYFAVHQVAGYPYKDAFAQIEAIFRRYGGRPHWGKLNTMTRAEAHAHYARLTDFIGLREESDPQHIFGNAYLDGMLV